MLSEVQESALWFELDQSRPDVRPDKSSSDFSAPMAISEAVLQLMLIVSSSYYTEQSIKKGVGVDLIKSDSVDIKIVTGTSKLLFTPDFRGSMKFSVKTDWKTHELSFSTQEHCKLFICHDTLCSYLLKKYLPPFVKNSLHNITSSSSYPLQDWNGMEFETF